MMNKKTKLKESEQDFIDTTEGDAMAQDYNTMIVKGLKYIEDGLNRKLLSSQEASTLLKDFLTSLKSNTKLTDQSARKTVYGMEEGKKKDSEDLKQMSEVLHALKEAKDEEDPAPKKEETPKEEKLTPQQLANSLMATSSGKRFKNFMGVMSNKDKAMAIIELIDSLPGSTENVVRDILRRHFSQRTKK